MISDRTVCESTRSRLQEFCSRISDEKIQRIRQVKNFAESQYANLAIPATLEFYSKRYVQQLFDFCAFDENTVIADVGAGYGWLSMAFAISTGVRVISIDADVERLAAGQEIADILGIGGSIEWRHGKLGQLPLGDKEADVVYCIEVLEHVYRDGNALPDLTRVSADLVILTTPNLWFPVIAHDTQLPFCHWLPIPMRRVYAKLFGRENCELDNLFWSPLRLRKQLGGFRPISSWLHYDSYEKYLDTFPLYLPYGTGRYVSGPGKMQHLYYRAASKLGVVSHWIVPSLAGVYQTADRKKSAGP